MTAFLSLRGVTKTFDGVHALSDVDLDVAAGEVCCLLGENGSGKSSLIKTSVGRPGARQRRDRHRRPTAAALASD